MIIRYKLGKTFGPSMVFAGYIIMVFGVLTTYFTFTSIGLILLGAVLAYTISGTLVDTEKREFKSYLRLAGFIPIGKVTSCSSDDAIEVRKFKGSHVTYSTSNRQSSIEVNEYRIYLINAGSKKKILLARFEKEEEAMDESRNLNAIVHM